MTDHTLFDYWMICYRRRLSILVLVGTAVLGAALIGASLPSIYEARAMFYVPTSATGDRSNAGDTSIPLPASNQDDAKANIGILKGRDALRVMHARFPQKQIDAFQRDVDFTAGRDGIIQVYVRDRDPKLAAAIANGYLDYFNQFLADQMRQRAAPKTTALTARIAEVGRELQAVATQRKELAVASGSPALETEALELIKEREDLHKELDNLRGSIRSREQGHQRNAHIRLEVNPAIDDLERQLAQIDIELARSRAQTLPNHPDQIALVQRREAAQAALKDKLRSLDESDRARAQTVASMLDRRESRLKGIPDQQDRITELDQRYRDLRAAMTFLKNNLEEVSLASVRAPQVGISTERAEAPQVPVFPIAWLNIAVAAVVSVLAGVLYALLLDYIADSGRRRQAHEAGLSAQAH